ncbi:MAG: hypothetical protein KKE17_06785, partial [Proteobacteria bacterium]|nr:hypothetical protein [Pseudomonadota bacterium]MBU1709694.1 hypothetical protein [Pseudomonadota bacterium]
QNNALLLTACPVHFAIQFSKIPLAISTILSLTPTRSRRFWQTFIYTAPSPNVKKLKKHKQLFLSRALHAQKTKSPAVYCYSCTVIKN